MNKEYLTKFLTYGALFLMLGPFLNTILNLVSERRLGGTYAKPKNPAFVLDNWIEGDFQQKKEFYLKQSFGFRQTLLRARYQWIYSAYNQSRLFGFVGCESGVILQGMYINSDRGSDYAGSKIDTIMKKLNAVYPKLRAEGKELLVVIAPSKTHYYKNEIPSHFIMPPNPKTNYKEYIRHFERDSIPYMDANAWFVAMKDTVSAPLFPKTGLHFSSYGAAVTSDSMVKHWERILGKDIPELYWDEVEWASYWRDEDHDMEWAMNLMYEIPNVKMAYPVIKFNEKGKYKPNILTIGDSFFWRFYRWDAVNHVYDNSKFLYYNKEVYPGKKKRSTFNLAANMSKLNGFCIFINPSQMHNFSWGFVDDLHDYYCGFSDADVAEVIEKIKKTPKWFAEEEKKAAKRSISIDSMMYIDALRFVRNRMAKEKEKAKLSKQAKKLNKSQRAAVRKIEEKIKRNPNWYASIKVKAKKRGIPVDSMLYKDARYFYQKQLGKK